MVWVYFRYEGVYKFCKECGCVGHNTSRCPLSAYEAQNMIGARLRELEEHGMTVLQTQEDVPLYTNQIRGLIDRFIHRNPRVNLLKIRPHINPPSQDPYLFPHLYLLSQILSDTSSDEFYDASPDFYRGANVQIMSDEYSQENAQPPQPYHDTSHNYNFRTTVSPRPGTRYGLGLDPNGFLVHRINNVTEPNTSLNLNFPPPTNFPDLDMPIPLYSVVPHEGVSGLNAPSHSGFEQREHISEAPSGSREERASTCPHGWAQGFLRMTNLCCVSGAQNFHNRNDYSPPSLSIIQPPATTLIGLLAYGRAMLPPGPDEAGPSNWIERNTEVAHMQTFGHMHIEHQSDNFIEDNLHDEPRELRNISTLITDRFRLTPPPMADAFNPLLQGDNVVAHEDNPSTSADNYSPTTPLDITFTTSEEDDFQVDLGSQVNGEEITPQRAIVLALPISSATFSAKTRRSGQPRRPMSVDSALRFSTDDDQTKSFKRKKRYEEWDAKGGFNIRIEGETDGNIAKAITDVSMARVRGVEPGTTITSRVLKKRPATTSPMDPTGDRSLKRNKSASSHDYEPHADVACIDDTQVMDEDDMDFTGGYGHQKG